ncbi:3-demethylubiquinone-9 3-methyltransferase-domain-containing protein [Lipomyces starkeyi]
MSLNKITTCLWFDTRAEEAANYYISIFKNSKITYIQRYTEAGRDIHHKEPGSALVVEFELNGHPFVALNGGPQFKFNESISFQVDCANQDEVDYYWEKLGDGTDEAKSRCGWLADKFGVSWQVVPTALKEMLNDSDKAKADRVMVEMMKMKKLDIAALRKAYQG